jgi:putative membrane protein
VSVLSLSKLISWLLENQPILLWSFFFGLVLASVLFIAKEIEKWNIGKVVFFIIGALLAYYITTLQPMITENSSPLYLFSAGALAICAMILPGISGAFILVLLGAYKPVLDAIHEREIKLIVIIGAGALVGLLTFSKILKRLFLSYKNYMLATLSGFVFGSLNKIWPWKETLTWRMNSKGVEVPFNEQSVLPSNYSGEDQLFMALVFALIGFLVILFLEKIAQKRVN